MDHAEHRERQAAVLEQALAILLRNQLCFYLPFWRRHRRIRNDGCVLGIVVAGSYARGAQGGHRAFNKLSNAVDSLAEVRTRLVEMRLWTLGVQDYLGRADPECARRIARTYPHLQAGEVIACARLLLDEYERICPAYCRKAGAA